MKSQPEHMKIRLGQKGQAELQTIETRVPKTMEDVAKALHDLSLGMENYPATAHHFSKAAESIRQGIACLELTGDYKSRLQ